MIEEPTIVEKMRGLPWSVAAWACNSVYAQLTLLGSVFVLFLSELGLSKSGIGDLLALMPFAGMIALFVARRIARGGYKRAFLIFFGARKAVTAFVLLTPWVLSNYGASVGLIYVGVIVAVFSLTRAVAFTALHPWRQEYIPDSVRGKYWAVDRAVSTVAGFVALAGARYVIDLSGDLRGFVILMGIGVGIGFLSVGLFTLVPGGGPDEAVRKGDEEGRALGEALRDRDFLLYLIGVGLVVLNTGPVSSFLPLFMRDQVGLSSGNVVWLQSGALLGGLVSSYLWGWTADRYGSKPIVMSGLYVRVALPVLWLLVPRGSEWSLRVAMGFSVIDGLATTAWAVGTSRLLYTGLVPRAKRSDYMALYYGWVGLVGGLSNVTSGRLLDLSAGISGEFFGLSIGPYFPLFAGAFVLGLVGTVPLGRVRAESAVGVREFAGLFLHGNPVQAMGSLIRYHRARDEEAVVSTTEDMGQAKSPLAVDELLEALSDPRFNVRFEAIISIARMDPDERLMEALIDTLESHDPAFSVMAAWGLGRMGDRRAIEPLRRALNSDYRSVRAHSARSLGTLEDVGIGEPLLRRLEAETDDGLQIAYSSVLGKFRVMEATDHLLKLLEQSVDDRSRWELALAAARMVGDEHHFVRLFRHRHSAVGSTASGVVTELLEELADFRVEDEDLTNVGIDCRDALEADDLLQALPLLSSLIRLLPEDAYDEHARRVLEHCAEAMDEHGAERIEYALLALHVIEAGRVP